LAKGGATVLPGTSTQANVIAGAIFIAFFIYVTAKGELPAYLRVFGL
jgi:hypothetical protein